jgi:hypothetical protein
MNLPETDFDRERQCWEQAPKERDSAGDSIDRALRWREIERRLELYELPSNTEPGRQENRILPTVQAEF